LEHSSSLDYYVSFKTTIKIHKIKIGNKKAKEFEGRLLEEHMLATILINAVTHYTNKTKYTEYCKGDV